MKINVLSAYQTTAEEFFNKILGWKATLVLDIRLRNTNQLSGFTKQEDLEYFTHVIAHADYVHDVEYSPTKSLLDAYLDAGMPYEEYFKKYAAELKADNAIPRFLQEIWQLRFHRHRGNSYQKASFPRRRAAEAFKGIRPEHYLVAAPT